MHMLEPRARVDDDRRRREPVAIAAVFLSATGTRPAKPGSLVSAQQARLFLAPADSSTRTPAVGQLAELVGDVVSRLEPAARGQPLHRAVAACNAALEGCLEAQRDDRDREDREDTARDDLARLARLLTVVDRADVAFVMRQIRRVLGRFDACGA